MTKPQSPPAGKRASFNKRSLRTNDEADIAMSAPGLVATLNERLFEADSRSPRVVTEILPVTGDDVLAEELAHQE